MTTNQPEKLLVTSALPYANGPIHFGHIAGAYLPADIFVRYQRLKGSDVVYICGTDEHGVAITINAERQGIKPQQLVDKYYKVIKQTFDYFDISFDNFSRTSLPEHYQISQQFFLELYNKGLIRKQASEQFYCNHDRMFLPDRYVLGVCPECGYENARGDECPSCGNWIETLQLGEPRCSICSNKPEIRTTEHWFLQLQDLEQRLSDWLDGKPHWKSNVVAFIKGMIRDGLEPRPVTRDLTWGVPVPLDEAQDKVLYVWFDAPIGYISSTVEWAKKRGTPELWKSYWQDEQCRLIHFIGKDNIPFHTIVFPAMLMGQQEPYILPENVPANEFYNYEGRKFSTSDGWYIPLDKFFDKYGTDPVRFTIMANAPENKDSEFTWRDFQRRNNAELADSLGNFVNRTLTFAGKYFDGRVPPCGELDEQDRRMLANRAESVAQLGRLLENYSLRKAAHAFIELSREGNRYFDSKAPWKLRKEDMAACGTAINVCLQVTLTLASIARAIIPGSAGRIFRMLGSEQLSAELNWSEGGSALLPDGQQLGKAEVLFRKIDDSEIEAELAELHRMAEAAAGTAQRPEGGPVGEAGTKDSVKDSMNDSVKDSMKKQIEYGDFAKLDLRIGRVVSAEPKKGSKKLLKLQVDCGGETRQVLGGLAQHYTAEQLVGKQVVIVFNLKPRKMMGELSEGMLLAAEDAEGRLSLLTSDGADTAPGSVIS